MSKPDGVSEFFVTIPAGAASLEGHLSLPAGAAGLVLFAHGSGSSRWSPRNRFVAGMLRETHIATLLLDLLTPAEETIDDRTRHLRFDISLLAGRLGAATDWVVTSPTARRLPIGYFGASTGAAAALVAAAARPDAVRAVVSRGGRPDLAGDALRHVRAPTLLIVGQHDPAVIALNQEARGHLSAENELVIVPNATHLFEEAGTLEEVGRLAAGWFVQHLSSR